MSTLEVIDLGGEICVVEGDPCVVQVFDVGLQGGRGETGFISSILGLYRIQTTVGGEPSSGHIRYNNATQTSATTITIADLTQDGIDIELFLGLLATGNAFVVQDKDDYKNYQIWEITGTPTENADYFSIPVSLTDSGGTGTAGFANNHQVFVAAFGGGAGGGGGSDIVESGSYASPNSITSTLNFPTNLKVRSYIQGSTGPVVNPTLENGELLQEVFLFGCSDTNTVELNSTTNLLLSGPIVLRLGSMLSLQWISELEKWVEVSRNEI